MDTLDLSGFFKTKTEAQQFADQVSTVIETIFQNGFDLETALTNQFGIQKKDLFLRLFHDNGISLESHTAIKGFLTTLLEKCQHLSPLTITLAFEPDEQTMQTLTNWCEMNIGKQVVFDIKVDHSLIGGATIYFNGKYFTFSIKPVFDSILSQSSAPEQPVIQTPLPSNSQQNTQPPAAMH